MLVRIGDGRRRRADDVVPRQDPASGAQHARALRFGQFDDEAVDHPRVQLAALERGQAVLRRQRDGLHVPERQAALRQQLDEEVMRRGRAHVADALALEVGRVADGRCLRHEHDLIVDVTAQHGDHLQRRIAGQREDRGDLAHAAAVHGAGRQRFHDQVPARELGDARFIGRGGDAGVGEIIVVAALVRGDAQLRAGQRRAGCRGRRPGAQAGQRGAAGQQQAPLQEAAACEVLRIHRMHGVHLVKVTVWAVRRRARCARSRRRSTGPSSARCGRRQAPGRRAGARGAPCRRRIRAPPGRAGCRAPPSG